MSNLRIGQVVPSLDDPNAGPSYSVTYLAQAIDETKRAKCSVYCVGRPASGLPPVEVKSFVQKERKWVSRQLWGAEGMADALTSGVETLLHSHGLWMQSGHYAAMAALSRGVPFVISPRGMLSRWAMAHHAWRKQAIWHWWQKRDLLSASLLHVTSDEESEDCARVGFTGPIALVRNGVDVPPLSGIKKQRQVVFLSRLHKKKGVDLLVAAWSKLEQDFRDWSLAIAGPDEDGSGVAAREQSLRLGCKRIEFVGPLHGEQKASFLEQASLFVLPTHSENFGIAVAEAMAHGLPVITTTGTPWQELENRKVGWWVPPTVDALLPTLRAAMAKPLVELTDMGARARQWMADEYSWNSIGEEMLSVYLWLLKQGDRPSCVRV